MSNFYYVVIDKEVHRVHKDGCYPPNEDGQIMVHTSKYGYDFFTPGTDLFETYKEAKEMAEAGNKTFGEQLIEAMQEIIEDEKDPDKTTHKCDKCGSEWKASKKLRTTHRCTDDEKK